MVIFAMVISILFSSFKAFILSSEAVKNEIEQSESLRTVYRRISMDLEALFVLQPPRYKKPEFDSDPDPYRFVGDKETIGNTVASSIMFASKAHVKFGADPRNGVSRITYFLRENKNNSLDLFRADTLLPFSGISTSCSEHVVCKNVSEFQAEFTDYDGNTRDYWNSDTDEFQYAFPASIDLKITLDSGEKKRQFTVSITLPVERNLLDSNF